MLPLAIELISGLIYGLIACELSHAGNCVDPGDITLFDNRFASQSSSVYKIRLFIISRQIVNGHKNNQRLLNIL